MNIDTLTTFQRSFLNALLWSEVYDDPNDNGITDEHSIEDIETGTLDTLLKECDDFCEMYGEHFVGQESNAGHDFALTRNHHGCGFWDGDWPEPESGILTAVCESAGEINLYVGDDGKLYS